MTLTVRGIYEDTFFLQADSPDELHTFFKTVKTQRSYTSTLTNAVQSALKIYKKTSSWKSKRKKHRHLSQKSVARGMFDFQSNQCGEIELSESIMKRGLPSILAAGVLLLSGCAATKSTFTCNATSTDSCMTMEEANQRAREITAQGIHPSAEVTNFPSMFDEHISHDRESLSLFSSFPVRFPEMTAQVWIAPWVDENADYHADSRIAFVVKDGEWK